MALYSTRQGRWITRPTRAVDTGPNPYDEGTKHFAERHQETTIELPCGLTRIDLGEPIVHMGVKVSTKKPAAPRREPADTPPETGGETATPAAKAPAERDWRKDYGMARSA
ncbi:hypothetical protein [Sphingomonas crocodyli]|uniref:Uncharacterized protein n=1 Tax=Sphingomonas crocodyli TaxID=1979270 RepID=A0A437M7B4_9SPHN|nr:hypothetical protein [Sphingomonas crocodyli]RVT93425.1 hypothetical protein EOD43_05990 [Sphingomonas crocodyli]